MDIEKVNKTVKVDLKEGLKEILPEIFEDNKINFEKLKGLLSGEIIEKEDDRFYFNWAGKSNIFKFIQAPAYGTLKPDKEKSIDFENTENIAIIGENLETLKLLLKPYFGKVKMIYIDPPYNTGKDFIYRDNFKEPLRDYLEKTGQIDSEGNKLTTNTEASGRYHSDWLNFIYPRLFLARNLLREDGVIFVSIDDNEVHHLRMIMDGIFGEENYLNLFCWVNNLKGRQISGVGAAKTHEYILAYAKNINNIDIFEISVEKAKSLMPSSYKGFDYETESDEGGDFVVKNELYNTNSVFNEETRPHLVFNIHYNFETKEVRFSDVTEDRNYEGFVKILPKKNNDGIHRYHAWRWNKEKIIKQISDLKFVRAKDGVKIFTKIRGFNSTFLKDIISDISTTKGTNEVKGLFNGKKCYDYPKPVELIKTLINQCGNQDIILDFFAGSGTTGQAVWDLNREDGGNRKFILVQLEEEVQDEEIKKEFPTVADICIERLRRVSEKYKREITSTSPAAPRNDKKEVDSASPGDDTNSNNQDFGFKVFRLDKSNFNLKDDFKIQEGEGIEELRQKYLEWLGVWIDEPLVSNWQKIDVIYEIILKEGLNLNSKIEKVKIKNNNFYYVKDAGENLDFYISLDEKIDNETIEEIRTTKYKNKMFVFLDKALTDDDKINLTSFVRLKVI